MAILCENCNERTATVFIEKNTNGTKTKYNLCQQCAHEFDKNISLDNFLQNFVNIMLGSDQEITNTSLTNSHMPPYCKNCGLTFDEFRKINRIGCSHCYEAFHDQLELIFNNIQKNSNHDGKYPSKLGNDLFLEKEISKLKYQLRIVIEQEEYEEAVVIRDKIKELENKINNQ